MMGIQVILDVEEWSNNCYQTDDDYKEVSNAVSANRQSRCSSSYVSIKGRYVT